MFAIRMFITSIPVAVVIIVITCRLAEASYKPTESDIDPGILAVDEEKALGYRFNRQTGFINDSGMPFRLGDLKGKSAILVFSYYTCDGACPAFNADLGRLLLAVDSLGRVELGKDYKVVTLSFDKNDGVKTANDFRKTLNFPSKLNDNWILGVFEKPEQIKPFMSDISYRFFWSAQDNMFLHPNAFFFLSPEGRIVRILHNTTADSKDMELALVDTMFNRLKPSQIITMAISFCYSYNYKEGKYGLNYPLFFAMGSLLTGLGALGIGLFHFIKRGKSKEMST
tara:strand:+ start:40138 stop:40986 length:849 start_codon:yes stop_codon:yes gene_type:complete